jgi:hypothetical protein
MAYDNKSNIGQFNAQQGKSGIIQDTIYEQEIISIPINKTEVTSVLMN